MQPITTRLLSTPALSVCLTLLLLIGSSTQAATGQLVFVDREKVAQTKQKLLANELSSGAQLALNGLYAQADMALEQANETVTDKTYVPPAASKHDYVSLSRYWWPNPSSKNGLPWIRKDGETNPTTQTDAVDRLRIARFTKAVYALGLAYHLSEDERYASKGIEMIRTWFINPDTAMNPNVNWGQMIPGNPKKRRAGILDTRLITLWVLDPIVWLSQSKSWTAQDNTIITTWFENYLDWLTTSNLGRSGMKQTNNHGSWYKVQVAAISRFLGRTAEQEKIYALFKRRFSGEVSEKGVQTHEVERTRALFYSIFNLDAMTRLAAVAQQGKTDLWAYQSATGASLEVAIDFVLPHLHDRSQWPYAHKKFDALEAIPVLYRAIEHGGLKKYQPELEKLIKMLASVPLDKRLPYHHRLAIEYYLLNAGSI